MKDKPKKNVHYNGMKSKIATDKLSMQPTNERQHMTRYWPNSLSPQWSRQICHNGFPPRLGRPRKYGVATDLFCTGVIGHPGHMFLN